MDRQLTVDGGRLVAESDQQLAFSQPMVEFVSGGEFAWVGEQVERSRGGVFVTWWASSRDVVVEDVIAFARCELKRAFGCVPVHFIPMDFCRYGVYPVPFGDDSGLVLWTLVHEEQLSAVSHQQLAVSGQQENEKRVQDELV